MKIYFAGSIRGGRDDKELYLEIITLLQKYGTVLTEHIGDASLSSFGETTSLDQSIYERDMLWLEEADVVVAEVSTPSLGVGYEIGHAEGKKPILCLYREQEGKRLSAMLGGNTHLINTTYQTIDDLELVFKDFFSAMNCVAKKD